VTITPPRGRARYGPIAETYSANYAALPAPLDLPWELRPVSSADSGVETLSDGRTKLWIRHDVLNGVTPRMLAWWFANMEGDIEIGRRRLNRYRVWHPLDHVHASYVRRRPDGTIGPGAAIRIREVLGRDPRHAVNVTTEIQKLDEDGLVHLPGVHIAAGLPLLRGLARMEYTFTAVPAGTRYENCLILGGESRWTHFATALLVPPYLGGMWIRHNIEEVGSLEHFLPELYHAETGERS
jgi:hypothetical protein